MRSISFGRATKLVRSSVRFGVHLELVCALQIGAHASGLEPDYQGAADQHKSWKQYGGGADQSHFMDLKQITKENVKQVQVIWNYADPAGGRGLFFNPIVVDGVMYVLAKGG